MNQVVQETKETVVSGANLLQYAASQFMSSPWKLAAGIFAILLIMNRGRFTLGKTLKLG